jgi:hypothetical protein
MKPIADPKHKRQIVAVLIMKKEWVLIMKRRVGFWSWREENGFWSWNEEYGFWSWKEEFEFWSWTKEYGFWSWKEEYLWVLMMKRRVFDLQGRAQFQPGECWASRLVAAGSVTSPLFFMHGRRILCTLQLSLDF